MEAESEIVNESIEYVEENQTERDIVRTSERNEQVGDDSDETINNLAANVVKHQMRTTTYYCSTE